MKIPIESMPTASAKFEQQQSRFDQKAIEALLNRLEEMKLKIPQEQQAIYRDALFTVPALESLLRRCAIREDDTLDQITEKLQQVQEQVAAEARIIRPEEAERKNEESEDQQESGVREQVMAVQEEINELYRVNQQIEEEQDRLREELVFLELFVTEKEEEPDAQKAVSMRVEHYNQELQRLLPEVKKGFFRNLFQRKDNQKNQDPFFERRNELEVKLARAIEGFESKRKQRDIQEARLRTRLQEIQVRLENSSEQIQSPRSWQELTQAVREGIQEISTRLDADFDHRRAEIEALESQRDALEREGKNEAQ